MSLLEKHNLTVIRKHGALPDLPFLAMKEKILGKDYTLTIIFCTPKESQERNRQYRDKNYPTNILSFPLSENEGEIYISLITARRDAAKFDMTYPQFLHLLSVHGVKRQKLPNEYSFFSTF
jgi:probable rRNA maturation factor